MQRTDFSRRAAHGNGRFERAKLAAGPLFMALLAAGVLSTAQAAGASSNSSADYLANFDRLQSDSLMPSASKAGATQKRGFVTAEECAARGGQLATEGRRYPFALRLGALLSPRLKFVGGMDATFPSLGIGPGWVGRADAEAIISANFGGISTIVPVTFDEVWYAPERNGSVRFYAGGGIGPYFGEVTRFGGKVFIGANFTPRLSGEVGLHFPGFGDPLLTAQIRLPF